MTTNYKILLAVCAGLFLASLTDAGSAIAWGALKPFSAVLFIVFYIGQLLHKEALKYDEEHRLNAKAPATVPSALKPGADSQKRQSTSALAGAH